MKKLIIVASLAITSLLLPVKSDSNTAVDLKSLAWQMCGKNNVYFVSKHLRFCKAAREIVCPEYYPQRRSETCRRSLGPRLGYSMIKVAKNVCSYNGGDLVTRRVQKHLHASHFCNRYKFYWLIKCLRKRSSVWGIDFGGFVFNDISNFVLLSFCPKNNMYILWDQYILWDEIFFLC